MRTTDREKPCCWNGGPVHPTWICRKECWHTTGYRGGDADVGEWRTLATGHNGNAWKGSVETGYWQYRVGLIGLTYGDLVHECEPTHWAEAEVNVLTPEETLGQFCDTAYVDRVWATVEPSSDGQGETVTLEWLPFPEFHIRRILYYQGEPTLPEGMVSNYRVERIRKDSRQDEGDWEMVARSSGGASQPEQHPERL